MPNVQRRTLRLPDDLYMTILRVPNGLTTAALRGMLDAEIYVLLGNTFSPTGAATGWGAYCGESDRLKTQTERAGVSLHNWSTRLGRLQPRVVVLIRRRGRPIAQQPRLLVEAAIIRAISSNYTVLNGGPPHPRPPPAPPAASGSGLCTPATALPGSSTASAQDHMPAAAGGSTREQLIRLVLRHGKPMSIEDLLRAAADEGIEIPGQTPGTAFSTRRHV